MVIIAYIVFFAVTFPVMLLRDRLFGTIYGFLFIYSIFALVGYLHYPGYSESLRAYFGDGVGYTAAAFIFLSMSALFVTNLLVYRGEETTRIKQARVYVRINGNVHAVTAVYTLLLAFTTGLVANYDDLSWYLAELESLPPRLSVFLLLFKMSVGFIAVLYIVLREKLALGTRALLVPTMLYAAVFLIAASKLGNRTDPAALMIGVLFYESTRRALTPRIILISAAAVMMAIIALSMIEYARYDGIQSNVSLSDRIIKNDYFAPAHILFAAIALKYVDLKEVVASNFANSLILMNYPYLQQQVTDIFNPGVASRSAGYAFYIFSEGYMVMGFPGFLYNAVVVTFFVKLWNAVACTNNATVNLIIRTLFATMAINVVRGQSSYFIKYGYTYILPVMVFAIVIVGIRIEGRFREAGV